MTVRSANAPVDEADVPARTHSAGTLYLCATPIGHLEDITLRVLRVLREVDVVAAEDTRRTKILLRHYGIATPLTSLHQFNEAVKGEQLCQRLEGGQSVAVVSDAGTPGISDPGGMLVAMAIERGIPVVALPGPNAAVAALSVSGLDTRRFAYEGFLPRRRAERRRLLDTLATDSRTLIFYEAPHRIARTVADMVDIWGDRRCALVRELTKLHEEVLRTTLVDLLQELQARPRRGEMVLVVEGRPRMSTGELEREGDPTRWRAEVEAAMGEGKTKKEAVAAVAQQWGVPRKVVYAAAVDIPGRPDPHVPDCHGDA